MLSPWLSYPLLPRWLIQGLQQRDTQQQSDLGAARLFSFAFPTLSMASLSSERRHSHAFPQETDARRAPSTTTGFREGASFPWHFPSFPPAANHVVYWQLHPNPCQHPNICNSLACSILFLYFIGVAGVNLPTPQLWPHIHHPASLLAEVAAYGWECHSQPTSINPAEQWAHKHQLLPSPWMVFLFQWAGFP